MVEGTPFRFAIDTGASTDRLPGKARSGRFSPPVA